MMTQNRTMTEEQPKIKANIVHQNLLRKRGMQLLIINY